MPMAKMKVQFSGQVKAFMSSMSEAEAREFNALIERLANGDFTGAQAVTDAELKAAGVTEADLRLAEAEEKN